MTRQDYSVNVTKEAHCAQQNQQEGTQLKNKLKTYKTKQTCTMTANVKKEIFQGPQKLQNCTPLKKE